MLNDLFTSGINTRLLMRLEWSFGIESHLPLFYMPINMYIISVHKDQIVERSNAFKRRIRNHTFLLIIYYLTVNSHEHNTNEYVLEPTQRLCYDRGGVIFWVIGHKKRKKKKRRSHSDSRNKSTSLIYCTVDLLKQFVFCDLILKEFAIGELNAWSLHLN